MTTTATAKLIIESVLNHYFTPMATQIILAADRSLESDKCFEWFYDSEHVMQAVQLFVTDQLGEAIFNDLDEAFQMAEEAVQHG